MTDYLIELFNIASALAMNFPLLLFPMQAGRSPGGELLAHATWAGHSINSDIPTQASGQTQNKNTGFVRAYIICHAVLICAAVFAVRRFAVMDINSIQILKLILLFAQFPLPIYIFRKRVWQTIFLIAVCLLYGPICTGIGNYIAELRFPGNTLLFAGIFNAGLVAVTFPLLYIVLRRIYRNPGTERATAFWQFAWLVPMSFHALNIIQGTYLSGGGFGWWFIGVRVISYFMLLLVCILFDVVTRQISEAEAEKLKNETIRLEAEAARREAETAKREAAMSESMNKQKTELMNTIAHEARTPLAALASYAGIVSMDLKDKGLEPQTIANLENIVTEAKRVSGLIDSMNKIILNNEGAAKRIAFDIGYAVRQTAELYRHILQGGGVELETCISKNLPPVFGSPEEITQVMFNLLQNARKSTTAGIVAVRVEPSGDHINVSVRDTGSGVKPELLPSVFGRGVSGDGGTGLGLAICKEIIESHGGTIKIESEHEKGTEVTFSLPIYERRGKDGE